MSTCIDQDLAAPVQPATLVDLLHQRARQSPDRVAYIFLQDDQESKLTYEALDSHARTLAGWLHEAGFGAERALVCCPSGLEYVTALFGCLYASVPVIPVAPPDPSRIHRTLVRFSATLRSAQPAIAITTRSVLAAVAPIFDQVPDLKSLRWFAIEDILAGQVDILPPPAPMDDALALLMYTSGSTGTPKGVMVSHRNIMHNAAAFPGFQSRPCRAIVSWLPLYHDLGFFMGVVHPLYQGVPAILMDALAFVQRPFRWLQAISRYRATTSVGPNFAYDLCVRKIAPEQRAALDLSDWNLALNGAEPIRHDVLERFTEGFAPCGFRAEAFYPSYGMADATATVTGASDFAPPILFKADRTALQRRQVLAASAPDRERVLVGCGPGLPDQITIVVDPDTQRRCAPDQVGEIWLAGPSVPQGYWNQPEETKRTFQAYLADTGAGPFFRTGDLGFIQDGEVFLVGRLKDMMIFRGQNHYSEDLELTVERSHPMLRPGCGAAFAVETEREERLVIVHELERPGDPAQHAEVVELVRQAVMEYHDIQAYVVCLIEKGSLPKTSSGKIARRACRDAFLSGQLAVTHAWRSGAALDNAPSVPDAPVPATADAPTADMISAWLVAQLSVRLNVPLEEIDPRKPFTRYALDSVLVVEIIGDLERWLGRPLRPTLFWDYPHIVALTQYLASSGSNERPRLGDILVEARLATAEQVQLALEEQRRSPVKERLGEILVRLDAITPDQVYAALLKQSGIVRQDALFSRPDQNEPIAIIGMACRFPGAGNLAEYWQLLCDGRDAITEVPPERWDLDALFDPDPSAPGKMYSRWGGFLDQLEYFDAAFMGISPREAAHLDPQQRLLMEVAWEALEDAGLVPDHLANSQTGVFIASISDDYSRLIFSDLQVVDAYSGTGGAHSILANRLSYFFNLRGPSIALDTACSGSLVALHLACQSLRGKESTLAIVGGVNINLLPDGNIFFSKAGVLSQDGRCKTFDERADGIVRGEGVGAVILKPLSRALADGNQVYAVVRGSAVNSDGRTNGIMAPNRQSQEAVLRAAYQDAGIAPQRVQYVEAHGTGTRLGDVIEAQALGAVVGANRAAKAPCRIGSVKTNIGHTEAAAGIASIIKVALALRHRTLPPSIHFQSPNPMIPFAELGLQVQHVLAPWPASDDPLIAGASGFGFGGTNAHIVFEGIGTPGAAAGAAPACLLPLSAKTPAALQGLARSYQQFLSSQQEKAALQDICYTAAAGRSHHEQRLAVVGRTHAELAEALGALLAGDVHAGLAVGERPAGTPGKLVFVFSGQGSHWPGMGRTLLEREPLFAETLRQCDTLLRRHVDWSLIEELLADEATSRLNQTDVTQLAIFAIQVSLAALWRSWGIAPDVVVGHSLGEVAAAHIAGVLSLDDALRVVYHRSRLMKQVAGRGRTAAVELSIDQARLLLAGREELLAVAGSNSPTSCILSGDPAELERVLEDLDRRQVFCRLLRGVDIAFHSPHMDPLKDELVQALEDITPNPAAIPIVSTVTGTFLDGARFDAVYWGRNLREPFLFANATKMLFDEGYTTFLEVSPHPVLMESILRSGKHFEQPVSVLPSLRRGQEEHDILYASLGTLYTTGAAVEWRRVFPSGNHCLMLPTYAWQRERYWLDQLTPAISEDDGRANQIITTQRRVSIPLRAPLGATQAGHPLVGHHLQVSVSGQHVYETALSTTLQPYLSDHRVQSMIVLPGAAYVEMALASASAGSGQRCRLSDIAFKQALFVPESGARTVQIVITPRAESLATFQIASSPPSGDRHTNWTIHATGSIQYDDGQPAPTIDEQSAPDHIRVHCATEVSSAEHYQAMQERGLTYGPRFQAITGIWSRPGESVGLLHLPKDTGLDCAGYHLHPILLDAAFQLVATTLPRQENVVEEDTFLPIGLRSFQIYAQPGARLWCHAALRSPAEPGRDSHEADLLLWDEEGRQVVAEVLGLRLQRLSASSAQRAPERVEDWLYTCTWQAQPATDTMVAEPGGTWFVFADQGGIGLRLKAMLEAEGAQCVAVVAGAGVEPTEPGVYRIDPGDPSALLSLFQSVAGMAQPHRIVYLWPLDAAPPTAGDLDAFETDQARVCGNLVGLVQAIASTGSAQNARVWLVTRGAQVVEDQPAPPAIAQAAVWGIGRVLFQEHPELETRLVDLDPALPEGELDIVLAALRQTDQEDQIAFRQGRCYVARLERGLKAQAAGSGASWRADGSYLITGGMGGLGLAVARSMVQQGARRLILMGRTPLPPRVEWQQQEPESRAGRIIAAIKDMEGMGATIHLAAVDVSDEAQVAAYLETYRREGWPPIRGVIHAAGVLRDQLLVRMDQAALVQVLRPKIRGAWLLHQLLRDEPLDCFIFFSSLASVLGSTGQANYAAGNAFMDALAHYRRSQGLCATSINWGPWAEVGMAARAGINNLLAAQGMVALTPDQGTTLLQHLLRHAEAQVIAVAADWERWRDANPTGGARPFLSGLRQNSASAGPGSSADGQPRSTFAQDVLSAAPEARQGLLEEHLLGLIARVLRMKREALTVDRPLSALGLDSIICIELKNSIEASLRVTFSLAYLLQGPSVTEMAAEALAQIQRSAEAEDLRTLVENLAPDDLAPSDLSVRIVEQGGDRLMQLLDKLEQLSSEEVQALLGA